MNKKITVIAAVFAMATSSFAMAQPGPGGKLTPAEYKAEKKHIEADEKMAKAECKKLHGAHESACKKEAEAKEKMAMANLKDRK